MRTTRYEVFEQALALIERRGGWTQGAFCRVQGLGWSLEDVAAFQPICRAQYCAMGAVAAACRQDESTRDECWEFLDALAYEAFGLCTEDVNDGVIEKGEARRLGRRAARNRILRLLREAVRITKAEAARQIPDLALVET